MGQSTFFIPTVNMMGEGCLESAIASLGGYGYRRALIVTDAWLEKAGVAAKVAGLLEKAGILSLIHI